MPEKVMRAVASPPTLFWAPMIPAIINMGLHALGIVYAWGLFKISPLLVIISLIVFHMVLAAQGAREPHMATLVPAWAYSKRSTRNLIKGKHGIRKYVP
jgi:hypothetical protein